MTETMLTTTTVRIIDGTRAIPCCISNVPVTLSFQMTLTPGGGCLPASSTIHSSVRISMPRVAGSIVPRLERNARIPVENAQVLVESITESSRTYFTTTTHHAKTQRHRRPPRPPATAISHLNHCGHITFSYYMVLYVHHIQS